MPETNTKITDLDLQQKVLNSLLPDDQKNQYADLIPKMDDQERAKLIKIIEDMNEGKAKFEEEKQDKLIKLNQEYEAKLKTASKEESKHILEESEKFEGKIEAKELEQIEEEIEEEPHVDRTETAEAQMATVKPGEPEKNLNTNHSKRNFILAFIGLIGLIAIILVVLSNL